MNYGINRYNKIEFDMFKHFRDFRNFSNNLKVFWHCWSILYNKLLFLISGSDSACFSVYGEHTLKICFDICWPSKSKWFDPSKSNIFTELWTIFVSKIFGLKWSPYVAEASLAEIYKIHNTYKIWIMEFI